MSPHAGFGGGTPTPRNERVASAMMTTPSWSEARTMTVFRTFGRMWRFMIVHLEQPATIASRTNSRSLSESTSPRMTRAYRVQ